MDAINLSHLNILIAEDQVINQFILRKIFSKWNLSPVFVSNGEEAVKACQSSQFDLVFLDIQMPIMGGYEAARIIRSKNETLPIIAISATAFLEASEEVKKSGMNAFIGKPYTPQELLTCIHQNTSAA
jgi:two-component system, sensor histidine kinase